MSEKTRPTVKPTTPKPAPSAPRVGDSNRSNNLPTFQNPPPPPPSKKTK